MCLPSRPPPTPFLLTAIYWAVRYFKKNFFFLTYSVMGAKTELGAGEKSPLQDPYLMSVLAIPKALVHVTLPGRKTILPTWRRSSLTTSTLAPRPPPLPHCGSHISIWIRTRVPPRPTAKFRGPLHPHGPLDTLINKGTTQFPRPVTHQQGRDVESLYFSSAPGWRGRESTSSGLIAEISSLCKYAQKWVWSPSINLRAPWPFLQIRKEKTGWTVLAFLEWRKEESQISNLKNFLNNHLI